MRQRQDALLFHEIIQSIHPLEQDQKICALPLFMPAPSQVDTMIVQAIALLDDLDKELNTYSMRVREWYGWHFPEMTKIVADNIQYAKTVRSGAFMPARHPCTAALSCPANLLLGWLPTLVPQSQAESLPGGAP